MKVVKWTEIVLLSLAMALTSIGAIAVSGCASNPGPAVTRTEATAHQPGVPENSSKALVMVVLSNRKSK